MGVFSNHATFTSTFALLNCVQYMHCSAPGKFTFDACHQLLASCQNAKS